MIRRSQAAALILVGAVLFCGAASAETVERIAAVIGDRIILASELASQVQMVMIQSGKDASLDPLQLSHDILEEMVNDELILSAARDDTTVAVTDAEVQAAVDEHLASLTTRFGSEDALLDQIRQEGWSKRSYENRLRSQVRDQILKQKIISQRLSKVTVSRQEVDDFYRTYADSLPDIPPQVRLAHILISFRASSQTEDSLRQLAEAARIAVAGGSDFSDVAATYGGGVVGGRIGFVKRSELVEEFARAAFNLQPGSISGPVRTEYGWHIIKSHQRLGDSVDVSQILFPVTASAADSARAKYVADSLYQELLKGADFEETAKLHSEDDATRATGGEMQPMTAEQLRPEFAEPLQAIDTGQITPPVVSQRGYHILRLLARSDGRKIDLNEDYDIVRNFARQQKTSAMVSAWVDDLKKKVYVDIRDVDLFKQ